MISVFYTTRHLFYTVVIFITIISSATAQNKVIAKGTVEDKKYYNDTIMMRSNIFSTNYHESLDLSAPIDNGVFAINTTLSYPHMYHIAFKSEADIYPYKLGAYFIDPSTTSIEVDKKYTAMNVNGKTAVEYTNKFVPFILGKRDTILDIHLYENGPAFDLKLEQYAKSNPNSYVALWFLIERFNMDGYKKSYNAILNSFSGDIKADKLWKIVNGEFSKIRIKENEMFPALSLKNSVLQPEVSSLPEAKYTLIDFWFSRCKPCLAQVPAWRAIYDKYASKGFNIINISTDKTENIEIWKKRVVEYGLIWKNYLDENGKEAFSEKIFLYPTNYLLDKNGIVLQKNISPEDLEKLLSESL
jgi:thiol-disulfide isomerase/thioredoxin